MSSENRTKAALDRFHAGMKADRLAHAYVVAGSVRGDCLEFVNGALKLLFPGCAGEPGRLASHPDIARVEPQKKSRIIGTEQMKSVCQGMARTSFEGGKKVCVITGADRMSDEAANAFLKTLEEPPGDCVFFLLTDRPDSLLSTITSRCQRISLSEGGDALPREWQDKLLRILAEAGGEGDLAGAAAARRVADLLAEIKESVGKEVAAGEAAEDEDDETLNARISARYREMRAAALAQLELWHRDGLLRACGADCDLLAFGEAGKRAGATPRPLTCAEALSRIDALEQMRERLERNMDETLVLNVCFERLF